MTVPREIHKILHEWLRTLTAASNVVSIVCLSMGRWVIASNKTANSSYSYTLQYSYTEKC